MLGRMWVHTYVGACLHDGNGVLLGVAGAWTYAHLWTFVGYMDFCQGLGVLYTHHCRVAPTGTCSFLLCQVSVGPLCFFMMRNSRPQTLDRTRYPGCRGGKLRHSKRNQTLSVWGIAKHPAFKPEMGAVPFRILSESQRDQVSYFRMGHMASCFRQRAEGSVSLLVPGSSQWAVALGAQMWVRPFLLASGS